jgi:hypothetical protein
MGHGPEHYVKVRGKKAKRILRIILKILGMPDLDEPETSSVGPDGIPMAEAQWTGWGRSKDGTMRDIKKVFLRLIRIGKSGGGLVADIQWASPHCCRYWELESSWTNGAWEIWDVSLPQGEWSPKYDEPQGRELVASSESEEEEEFPEEEEG